MVGSTGCNYSVVLYDIERYLLCKANAVCLGYAGHPYQEGTLFEKKLKWGGLSTCIEIFAFSA